MYSFVSNKWESVILYAMRVVLLDIDGSTNIDGKQLHCCR